jgi:hypothetical protein
VSDFDDVFSGLGCDKRPVHKILIGDTVPIAVPNHSMLSNLFDKPNVAAWLFTARKVGFWDHS